MARILLVDDEADFSEALQCQLREQGHDVRWLDRPEDALRELAAPDAFDLVLLDNKMPRMSGLEFLAAARNTLRVPVILITSAHNDQTAIQATNRGAFAYVLKPENYDDALDELGPAIHEALEINRRPRPVQIRPAAGEDGDDSTLLGRSKPMLDVLMRIGRLADATEPVLILGETGTGKDLVAQAIHTNSPRKSKPFVVMNCSAFDDNLLDDELFGHEVGAFTGADRLRKGRFEHAHGGTLFLDEVGDMPPKLQAKLLRTLENHEVVRLGSNDPIRVDVRVLAATHRDLKTLVRQGEFRQDLYYRLEGMVIHLPPLRERGGDIELLARRFLARMFGGSSAPCLHPLALEQLRSHPWPGNVRQLQKVLCRAVGACRGTQIMPEDLDFGELDADPHPAPEGAPCADSPQVALRRLIAAAWQSGQPNLWPLLQDQLQRELLQVAKAQQPRVSEVKLARRLGMSRNYLRARLKHYGLEEQAADA